MQAKYCNPGGSKERGRKVEGGRWKEEGGKQAADLLLGSVVLHLHPSSLILHPSVH
jgi:hypothetical protein